MGIYGHHDRPAGMNTILVINSKGGVGKTTITTNLASYFAVNNVKTAIMDYDPQESSLHWIRQRAPEAPHIHGASGGSGPATGLRSHARYVPADTQQLILDAPAGPSKLLLQEMLAKTDCIVIPVAPSAIDIQATANFIKDLLLVGGVRHRNIRVAIVANRVRSSAAVYEPLERFVASLKLSFLTRILDSEVYIEAAETGQGIFEMDAGRCAAQRREFLPLVRWVTHEERSEDETPTNVIPLKASRG